MPFAISDILVIGKNAHRRPIFGIPDTMHFELRFAAGIQNRGATLWWN